MTEIEKYTLSKISQLVLTYDKIEVKLYINNTSHSVEFFVTNNGNRTQCFEMVDNGEISEQELRAVTDDIVHYIRSTAEYKSGQVNKYSFVLN